MDQKLKSDFKNTEKKTKEDFLRLLDKLKSQKNEVRVDLLLRVLVVHRTNR